MNGKRTPEMSKQIICPYFTHLTFRYFQQTPRKQTLRPPKSFCPILTTSFERHKCQSLPHLQRAPGPQGAAVEPPAPPHSAAPPAAPQRCRHRRCLWPVLPLWTQGRGAPELFPCVHPSFKEPFKFNKILPPASLGLHQTASLHTLEKTDPFLPPVIHWFSKSLANISMNLPFIHIRKSNKSLWWCWLPALIFDIFTSLPKYEHFLKSIITVANRWYWLCCAFFSGQTYISYKGTGKRDGNCTPCSCWALRKPRGDSGCFSAYTLSFKPCSGFLTMPW